MMSTIAGDGTNSDGSGVTTTGREREKTDAEMTGTTGKKKGYMGELRGLPVSNRIQLTPMQPHHLSQTCS